MDRQVPKRISNIIINALKGGVVPRVGLEYVTVGRTQEINAILHDIDIIEDGGATFRFVVGKYGSGKSFLLQTIRNYLKKVLWWWTWICRRKDALREPKGRAWQHRAYQKHVYQIEA